MPDPPGTDGAEAARLERLERRVDELAARLAALEGGGAAAVAAPRAETLAAAPEASATSEILHSVPALAGRTLVVLGGAFVTRSLAESGALSPGVGVSLGIAYAFVWLFFADRAARRGLAPSGAFHALASALIVYPLIFEATTRLALLAPVPAALLLVAANGAGLAVAWRRDFRVLAWIQQVATLAVAVPLLFRTRSPIAFGLALLALAVSSLVLAYGRGWRGQRWLVAIGVDTVIALLGALWLVGKAPPAWLEREAVVALQLGLAAIYLGAFVLRLLFQERQTTLFAVLQTVAVLWIGFEGALAVAAAAPRAAVAWGALVASALLHAVLARRAEARVGHGAAVGYFASVATFLAAEAVRVLLPAVAPLVWSVAAVALGVLALTGRRPFLQAHAALLAFAATALSGLFVASLAAMAVPAKVAWPAPGPWAPLLLVLVAATAGLLYRGSRSDAPQRLAASSRVLALSTAVVVLGGQVTGRLGAAFAAAPGAEADAAGLAVLRTAVLAAAALLLAAAARRWRFGELVRLAAAVLVCGGLKLLLEDLRVGDAAHLVFSFAIYGATLIAVPALVRRRPPAAAAPAET